jgi:hypothetical protein
MRADVSTSHAENSMRYDDAAIRDEQDFAAKDKDRPFVAGLCAD